MSALNVEYTSSQNEIVQSSQTLEIPQESKAIDRLTPPETEFNCLSDVFDYIAKLPDDVADRKIRFRRDSDDTQSDQSTDGSIELPIRTELPITFERFYTLFIDHLFEDNQDDFFRGLFRTYRTKRDKKAADEKWHELLIMLFRERCYSIDENDLFAIISEYHHSHIEKDKLPEYWKATDEQRARNDECLHKKEMAVVNAIGILFSDVNRVEFGKRLAYDLFRIYIR